MYFQWPEGFLVILNPNQDYFGPAALTRNREKDFINQLIIHDMILKSQKSANFKVHTYKIKMQKTEMKLRFTVFFMV